MNTIKKLLWAALALLLLGAPALAEELPAFGVCIYDGTDTFMASAFTWKPTPMARPG